MSTHDARLVPAAVLGLVSCIAVLAGVAWGLVVGSLAVTSATASIVAVCARRSPWKGVGARAARWRHVVVAVAFATAIAALLSAGAAAQEQLRMSPDARAAAAAGATVNVDGVVTQEARPGPPDRFTGEPTWETIVEARAVDGAHCKAPMRVLAMRPEGLELGAAVRLRGSLQDSPQPRFAAVLWGANVKESEPPTGIMAVVGEARDALRRVTAHLPVEVKGLTRGMVIGDDSSMPTAQRDDMRQAGLAHLTAVSGAHFAIVVALTVWLLRRTRLPRKVHALGVAMATGGFALLVGPEPSVVRAFAMAGAIVLALLWGRPARAVAALCGGVVVILAIDPFVATALGFQLSVVAVAGIVLWAPHLALRLQRWVTAPLAHGIAVPTAAACVTAPLLVGISGGVGAFAVAANLVAAPFAAPVTIFGLIALGMSGFSVTAAHAFAGLAGLFARPVAWAARAFANAPGAWIAWPEGPLQGFMLASIVALAIAATTSRRVRGWGLIATLIVIVTLAIAGPRLTATPAARLPDWDVVTCDVGQGDMMLLRSAASAAVVIDTGPPEADAAGCLRRHGVQRIDLLIVTHPHRDHEGGVGQLVGAVPISRAWLSPAARGGATETLLSAAGVPVHFAVAGDAGEWGDVVVHVLAPQSGQRFGEDELNDSSVVVIAWAGGAQVLALGDLESAGQSRLAATLPPVVVDVVKVAHHGSADQSESLARLITARVAVVSVGASNTYGHPSAHALELYLERAWTVQRTDLCGDVVIAVGDGVRIASRCAESLERALSP